MITTVLTSAFVAIGVLNFTLPSGLPEPTAWTYDLPTVVHWVTGIMEPAGGLGHLLPSLARGRPRLRPLTAGGLAVVAHVRSRPHPFASR